LDHRLPSFPHLVAGTFLFGWTAGLLVVLKCWHLVHAPRWLMVTGAGYVAFMLLPILCGVGVVRLASRLVGRGWGATPFRFLALGLCGLVAGLMAI
jgi:hypothetical protein